jgi:predicted phosphodiesterase
MTTKQKLLGILTAATMFASSATAQTVLQAELLGRPTDKGITIQMFFDQGVDMRVNYGLKSGLYIGQTAWQSFMANEPAEIEITGLLSDTQYYYSVSYRKTGTTAEVKRPEFRFRTAKSKGKSFTFVIQADPHLDEQSDTGVYNRCLKNQLEDNPDFMIDLGDILMSDKLRTPAKVVPRDTVTYRAKMMRGYYEKLGHSVPVYMVIGNHEGECGWLNTAGGNNVAVWGTVDRKKYFLNPIPGSFYSGDTTRYPYAGARESYTAWQWGDALFITLDPYWFTKPKPDSLNGWRWTLGKTQYDWLKTTLEKSDAKYKFVFSHQLVGGDPDGRGGVEYADRYEWGGSNLDGTPGFANNRPGWYKPIKDLLQEHRVNIFFHGHDHFFGKQQKSCLIYQEVPQPSHPNFSGVSYADDYGYFEGQILPNSGHLRVTVSPAGVKVEYVRVYLPKNETGSRKNKDVSASYFIGEKNCYDSLTADVPVLWNGNYEDELVYPNPFKGQVQFDFNVKTPENISVQIVDASGRQVRQMMAPQNVQTGRYLMVWDGKNNEGAELPAGYYQLQIRGSHSGSRTKKLILNP